MMKAVHPRLHPHFLMGPKIPTLEWQQPICMGNVPGEGQLVIHVTDRNDHQPKFIKL